MRCAAHDDNDNNNHDDDERLRRVFGAPLMLTNKWYIVGVQVGEPLFEKHIYISLE